MKTVVLSLGGSLVCPDKVDTVFLKKFRDFILSQKIRFVIITGGGNVCREYQDAASNITEVQDIDNDWVGIASTRLNAELVRAIFSQDAYEKVYGDPEKRIETDKRVIIGAGYLPGHSSDMDAVLLAKTFGAETVINMSNIEKAYTEDPKINSEAEPIDSISWDDFQKLVGTEWEPGKNVPFDPKASLKANELGLKVIILGKDLDNLRNCIEGKEFTGTTIS